MKDRVFDLCKLLYLFNFKSEICKNNITYYLNKDIVEYLIKYIIKIEPPQILLNTRCYNLTRLYDTTFFNIFKKINNNEMIDILKLEKPLIRCIYKKTSSDFRIFLEKLSFVNDNLLKVLLPERPIHNRNINVIGNFHQVIYRRYLLAFTKIDRQKRNENIYLNEKYRRGIIISIYDKFDNLLAYNTRYI